MKTLLFYASVTITLFIFLSSCTKEKPDSPLVASPQSDEKLVSQVHWFMDAAKDVKEGKYLKSGEKMFIDSALYYISATLNYKYSFFSKTYSKLKFDTVMVNIPFIGVEAKTYVVDALMGYNITIDKLRNKYNNIPEITKNIVCTVIQNAGTTPANDSIQVRIIAQFGIGELIVPNQESGYWWTRDGGDCNGFGDYGAPKYLESFYYGCYYLPYPCAQAYFTETAIHKFGDPTLHLNPNGGLIDNFCDYQIYYAKSNVYGGLTYDVKCIGSDSPIPGYNYSEIEYYQQGLQAVISDTLSLIDRDYISILIEHDDSFDLSNVETIKHVPYMTYGIIHFRPGPDCGSEPYPISILD